MGARVNQVRAVLRLHEAILDDLAAGLQQALDVPAERVLAGIPQKGVKRLATPDGEDRREVWGGAVQLAKSRNVSSTRRSAPAPAAMNRSASAS